MTILATLNLASVVGISQKDRSDLEARIARIENGLQRNLQIVGEEIPIYNIKERMKELNIPGLSIAVITDGKIEWAKGYGYADLSKGRKVTTETLFRAASISKPISALRVLQLAEEGKISLDANVNDYLMSWKVPDSKYTTYEKVTPRRILNHSAGLTVRGFSDYRKGDVIPSTIDILNGKGKDEPVQVFREPGKDRTYSGGGYHILQLLVIEVDQRPFAETMETNILKRLGMNRSTFTSPLPQQYHSVAATQYRPSGNEIKGKWPIYPQLSAAGLWTTPSDLARYVMAVQEILFTKEEGILTYETVLDMLTEGEGQSGLGPKIGKHVFLHGGGSKGNRSLFVGWKESANGVAIMMNTDNDLIIHEIMLSIAKEYDLPEVFAKIKTVIEMSDDSRKKYIGEYTIQRYGQMHIRPAERGLEMTADFMKEPIPILPESATSFFDARDGATYQFDLAGDKVKGFEIDGLTAVKMKD